MGIFMQALVRGFILRRRGELEQLRQEKLYQAELEAMDEEEDEDIEEEEESTNELEVPVEPDVSMPVPRVESKAVYYVAIGRRQKQTRVVNLPKGASARGAQKRPSARVDDEVNPLSEVPLAEPNSTGAGP